MDASLINRMRSLEGENQHLKRMYADLGMQADLLKEVLGKKRCGHPLPGRQMHAFAVRGGRGISDQLSRWIA